MLKRSEKVLHRERDRAIILFVAKIPPAAYQFGPLREDLLVQRGLATLSAQAGAMLPSLPNLAGDGPANRQNHHRHQANVGVAELVPVPIPT